MKKKTTRLTFMEEDFRDDKVVKAHQKAEKIADRSDKAKSKIITDKEKAATRSEKLRFAKAEVATDNIKSPSKLKRAATLGGSAVVSKGVHEVFSKNEDENAGVDSARQSGSLAETSVRSLEQAHYSHKMKKYSKAERLEKKADKANINTLYEKQKSVEPSSNPFSRWKQKQDIKKEYAVAKTGKGAKETAGTTKTATKNTKKFTEKIGGFISKHSHTILLVLGFGLVLTLLLGAFSSCSVMFHGGMNTVLGTSYTAEDEDIIGANDDYKALEAGLQSKINNIESTHSGYDEYRYHLDEINHNPYELTSYLTVKFEDYTRAEVQDTLRELFDRQYELSIREEIEIRTRTETRTGTREVTDPETGETTTEEYEYEVEVEYEYRILHVTLKNKGLGTVIAGMGMSDDEMERYAVLLQTRGNRAYLFEDDIYSNSTGPYTDYDIPGEALTDEKFAKMIKEAEKYLGYPYVWGGSSPSTSFDCSGFVSWVINNCGNGWKADC